jgi:hypothetical protein
MNGQPLDISFNSNSPKINVSKNDILAPQKLVDETSYKPKKAPTKKPTKKPPTKPATKKAPTKKLPNDKRTNEQRMVDYQNCTKKNCDCHGKNKWDCCPQCKNTLRKRIPTNKDGVPNGNLGRHIRNKSNNICFKCIR